MNPPPSATEPAFDSLDMSSEDFKQLGYEVIDVLADYYASIRRRRIVPESSSKEIERAFKEDLPKPWPRP